MKKRFLFIALILLLFSACAPAQTPAASGKKQVYASFYPMYDFTLKLADGLADVYCMVPSGTEPHDWEPSGSEMAALEKADVFIYNGAGLEFWAEDVLNALSNKKLIVVEAAKGLDSGAHDPHVWLDPRNARAQMEAIAEALSQADEANRDNYARSLARWQAELDALDAEFRTALDGLEKRDIIVAHEAYGYLCSAYGLTQHGIQGVSPDVEPTPARMAEIIELAKNLNVDTIFFEELASPKVAETIAAAVGAQTAVLSPLEGLTDTQSASGGDYFSVMRENLDALVKVLDG